MERRSGNFSWCYNISRGWIVHKGERQAYGRKALKPQQRVGIHVDRICRTLSFSLDGIDLGVAFTGLPDKDLYPVINIAVRGCVLRSEPYIKGAGTSAGP